MIRRIFPPPPILNMPGNLNLSSTFIAAVPPLSQRPGERTGYGTAGMGVRPHHPLTVELRRVLLVSVTILGLSEVSLQPLIA